jgi:hypothetical protein
MSDVDLPARIQEYGGDIRFERIALIEDDCTPDLPWFDVETKKSTTEKKGDPRYHWYRERFGTRCWELDALNPNILRARVADAIGAELDREAWDRAEVAEAAERESLSSILNAWPGISGQASEYDRGQA